MPIHADLRVPQQTPSRKSSSLVLLAWHIPERAREAKGKPSLTRATRQGGKWREAGHTGPTSQGREKGRFAPAQEPGASPSELKSKRTGVHSPSEGSSPSGHCEQRCKHRTGTHRELKKNSGRQSSHIPTRGSHSPTYFGHMCFPYP